jgi:hypothetical protein
MILSFNYPVFLVLLGEQGSFFDVLNLTVVFRSNHHSVHIHKEH